MTRLTTAFLLCASFLLILSGCGAGGAATGRDALYVPDLLKTAQTYNGTDVTVDGAYLGRNGASLLALGVSTLDNGLDAQPLGDPIWLDSFPDSAKQTLHQPGDATYGFVRVRGRFETGSFGPEQKYKYRITVSSADPIEQVRRKEVRVPNGPLGEGKVALSELLDHPEKYNGQTVTTRGYYFWNSVIFVLSEGISTEEDGSSPQPIGRAIWLEGFPPEESGKLNLGPNNSFVWGYVEVTGEFKTGGGFGKDGKYPSILTVTGGAKALEPSSK